MKIEHLAIWTEDIEVLRRFYMKYFGLSCSEKYINPKKRYESYFLSFGGEKTRIELMCIPDIPDSGERRGVVQGLAHFALSVGGKEAVDMYTEILRNDGYAVLSDPRTTGDGYYESVVSDPEGNVVEITE